MSGADKMIFFDLPAVNPAQKAWSPNTWKTRYALNYKGIPYRTEWVEFPDIAEVCIKYGAKASATNADGSPYYTLPMIYDPSTKVALADSDAIALYLDTQYPSTPNLFPAGTAALQMAVLDGLFPLFGEPLFFAILASIAPALPPRSRTYFRTTREAKFGKPLEQICVGEELEGKWAAAEAGLGKVAAWLSTNGPGKDELFLGDRVSYVDIQVTSILIFVKVILGEDTAGWKRVAGWHGGKWKRLLEYFDQWGSAV